LRPAFAIQVTLSFTVSGFVTEGPPAGVPTDPVTGSFTYDAPSITSDPTSLTAVNLTIGGHAYTLAEVGSNPGVIGAVVNGVGGICPACQSAAIDDFFLAWAGSPASPLGEIFAYATSNIPPGTVFDGIVTQFSVTATPMPEPSTWAMMALGFAGLGLLGYRKARSALA
jgi:hypothetical protein